MHRILLVDDDSSVIHALERLLVRSVAADKLSVETYTDPLQALARAQEAVFDVVISDYRMPTLDGVSFLKRWRALQPDSVRLILSANTDFETLLQAINEAGIWRFLPKPWDNRNFVDSVLAACDEFMQHDEERRLAEEQLAARGGLGQS
jgi:DNA-binding NtrC family response regulator